jgi:hypothetical protein
MAKRKDRAALLQMKGKNFSKTMAKTCEGKGGLCTRKPASPKAKFCRRCFILNASVAGSKGGGVKGNKGGKGVKGNNGGKGVKGNKGNTRKGPKKKAAGRRSGLKRATKDLLLIKNPWLQLLLRKRKTWEIRGSSTQKRGLIHLGLSGSGGEIHGRARIVDCRLLTREELRNHKDKHCIEDIDSVRYAKIYAWVFSDAFRYKKPLQHSHKQGAIIWCRL